MIKEIQAWQCEKCGSAYITKEAAEKCCKAVEGVSVCRTCGKEIEKHMLKCFDCRMQERYEKGTKIKYSEYETKWLYDETAEAYFSDVDTMSEHYEEIEAEMPKWCFGCNEIDFAIEISGALENAAENMYEDFDYDTEAVDIQELYKFIEQWNSKQTARTYEIDYKKIILLEE